MYMRCMVTQGAGGPDGAARACSW